MSAIPRGKSRYYRWGDAPYMIAKGGYKYDLPWVIIRRSTDDWDRRMGRGQVIYTARTFEACVERMRVMLDVIHGRVGVPKYSITL